MSKFFVEFGKDTAPPSADGRLEAPAFQRNHDAIWSVLSRILGDDHGDVLELGSGTGEHATTYARRAPHLTWWPSDIADAHIASITAWREHAGLANLRPPQRIDLLNPNWIWQDENGGTPTLTAMMCNNVLHISPWAVSQNLIAGAGRVLRDGGHLFIYGPFKRGGDHTAPSNAAFDASLRQRDPSWGVRDADDLEALGKQAGLTLTEIAPMPANNLALVFTHDARQPRP